MNQIFPLILMREKAGVKKQTVYVDFIDLEKSYHRVKRKALPSQFVYGDGKDRSEIFMGRERMEIV